MKSIFSFILIFFFYGLINSQVGVKPFYLSKFTVKDLENMMKSNGRILFEAKNDFEELDKISNPKLYIKKIISKDYYLKLNPSHYYLDYIDEYTFKYKFSPKGVFVDANLFFYKDSLFKYSLFNVPKSLIQELVNTYGKSNDIKDVNKEDSCYFKNNLIKYTKNILIIKWNIENADISINLVENRDYETCKPKSLLWIDVVDQKLSDQLDEENKSAIDSLNKSNEILTSP